MTNCKYSNNGTIVFKLGRNETGCSCIFPLLSSYERSLAELKPRGIRLGSQWKSLGLSQESTPSHPEVYWMEMHTVCFGFAQPSDDSHLITWGPRCWSQIGSSWRCPCCGAAKWEWQSDLCDLAVPTRWTEGLTPDAVGWRGVTAAPPLPALSSDRWEKLEKQHYYTITKQLL